MENNLAELTTGQITVSSELASFPFTNAISKFRSRVWKPSGRFTIDSTNKNIYINDGSDKTAVLTEGEYTTPELLATEIQTQLNSVSSNWTVTYLRSAGKYKFNLANTGSVTLRLLTTTNAAWETLGYELAFNPTDTNFEAQFQRNHWPNETVTFDLGYNAPITFFALIGPLNEVFSVSTSATIELLGSNLNQWDSPPFSVTIDHNDLGAFKFLDDLIGDDGLSTAYRFWRVVITDVGNVGGPNGISIGNIYLGDYLTLDNRNIKSGFERNDIDPSRVDQSESGVLHFDTRTKYRTINGASFDVLPKADKDTLTTLFNKLGTTTPFYISIDPLACTTDTINELTFYCVFNESPSFTHIINETYSMSFSVREVL
jgi:hypothetical protein